MSSVMVWNARGAANASTTRRLKRLCRSYNFSIFVLLAIEYLQTLCSMLNFTHSVSTENNKIWVLWRHGLEGSQIRLGDLFIHCQMDCPAVPTPFFFTFIYAKHTRHERQLLWTDLLELQQVVGDRPWMLGGDFNVISSLDEYVGLSTPNLEVRVSELSLRNEIRAKPTPIIFIIQESKLSCV